MLGHISIASMGGAFSQDPDTGAAEATYFPAESVVIAGSIEYGNEYIREAATTEYDAGILGTVFWIKAQMLQGTPALFPKWFSCGTLLNSFGARTWMSLMLHSKSVTIMENETTKPIDGAINPTDVWTFFSRIGEATSTAKSQTKTATYTCAKIDNSLQRSTFGWRSGPSPSSTVTRFFGDYCRNATYSVAFRRIPMRSPDALSVALYEADAKQLIEY